MVYIWQIHPPVFHYSLNADTFNATIATVFVVIFKVIIRYKLMALIKDFRFDYILSSYKTFKAVIQPKFCFFVKSDVLTIS